MPFGNLDIDIGIGISIGTLHNKNHIVIYLIIIAFRDKNLFYIFLVKNYTNQ